LLRAADRTVWLDLPPNLSAYRIVRRHVRNSLDCDNPHKGLRLLARFTYDAAWRYFHRPVASDTELALNPAANNFAPVAMLGLLGLRIFEATGADIADLREEHGHCVLRVVGKGTKVVLVPLPPAVARAIDRAVKNPHRRADPANTYGARMDRHAATRRLQRLAQVAGVRLPRMHPHMLRHTFVTTMLDAGADLRGVQIAARHADPRTTMR
jgi:integrase/recombinase XerD